MKRRSIRLLAIAVAVLSLSLATTSPAVLATQGVDCAGLDGYLVTLEAMGAQMIEALPASGESDMSAWTTEDFTAMSGAVDTAVTDLQAADVPAVAEEFHTLLIQQLTTLSAMFDTMATAGIFGALVYAEQLDTIDQQLETAADAVEAACGVDLNEDVGTAEPAATPQSVAVDQSGTPTAIETTTGSGTLGTRENPIPMGQAVALDADWELTVLSVTPNATDQIMTANSFNDPPASGHQFFVATIQITYTGATSGEFSEWSLNAVGQSAIGYNQWDDSCGTIPNELVGRELFTGGTIHGNVCWSIASDDAASLVLYDTDQDQRVFLSLMPNETTGTPAAASR